MTSLRQQSINQARTLLGDNRLLAFFRWSEAASLHDDPMACRCMVRELDGGSDLDAVFAWNPEGTGFLLHAEALGGNRFRIEFGYNAGFLCGDGAEWEVTFSDAGEVLHGSAQNHWIS